MLDRSMGERARDNIGDGFRRSAVGATLRSADPNADGLLNNNDLFSVDRGSPLDWILDHTAGQDRTFAPENGRQYDPLGSLLRPLLGQSLRDTPQAAQEDARRARYDERARQDPIRSPGDAVAMFGGQLVGALPSPENWVGGGSVQGLKLAPRLALRFGEQAAVAGATDVALQGSDIGAGIEDRYDPMQTLLSAGVGGLLGPAVDEGLPAAGRTLARGSQRAARFGGRLVGSAQDYVNARLPDPMPSFNGPAMDSGPVPRPAFPSSTMPDALRPRRPRPARALAIPEAFRSSFDRAASESGVPIDYLARVANRESGFRPSADAPTSSARGLFQFTERTWLSTLRAHGAQLGVDPGLSRAEKLALRDDPDLNTRAGALLTRDNAAALRGALGRDPTQAEMYSAHFLGSDGARRLAGADHDASAAALLPLAARSNRTIFFEGERPRTVAEVQADFARTFAGGQGGAVAPTPRRDIAPIRATAPEAGPLEGLQRRFPDARPEELEAAIEAARNPAAGNRVRELLTERLSPREARNAGRSMVYAARGLSPQALDASPERVSFSRLSAADNLRTPGAEGVRLDAEVPAGLLPGAVAGDIQPNVSPVYRAPLPEARGGEPRFAGGRAVEAPRFGGRPVIDASSGQANIGLRNAPRPDAVARGEGVQFQGKTVSDLITDLRSTLGLTHRGGRVEAKGALGTYNRGSGVVRTQAVKDLDVLAHEATHALEFQRSGSALQQAMQAHAAELKALDYEPTKARRHEGFAEFGRWYLTNPDHARRIAPGFYDAFEQAMQADAPEVLAGMKAVQDGYQNLLNSASIDVAKGSIAYTGNKGPVGEVFDSLRRDGPRVVIGRLMDKLYTALMDDLHPLAVAERELLKLAAENGDKAVDLKRAASPYALARLGREAYAAGHNDLMNGVTPYQALDPEGPALADALETAGLAKGATGQWKADALREFDAYLISRRMVHEWDRYGRQEIPNPPDRNTRQFHEQVIADAEAAHPTWSEAAGQVYAFLNNLWRKEFEAGLITKESYENGLTAHPDYVPLMRDMSDKGVGGRLGKPRGALQFAGGVKAFEGSQRDIISPLSSIMRRSYELNAIIRRNDVMKALDELADKAGAGGGAFVERLPAHQIEAVTVEAQQALRAAADELGLTGRDLSTLQKMADDAAADDLTLTVFKQAEFSPRKGEAVVFVWRDGKKTPLLLADGELGQEMFQALGGINRDMRNAFVDVMATGTQALRYGVTLSPEFVGANLVRDALATWINTDVGFVPGVDTVRGGVSEVAQDQWAKRYATAGGMRGGANTAATAKPFPRTDADAERQLQHLRQKGWKVKRFASWRGLAELTDLSETSTRLGVFIKGFEKAKREGLTDWEALIESGFTSRDYLDFGRHGSKMITAVRLVTFLNAALQGLDKSARVLTAGGDLRSVLLPDIKGRRTAAKKAAVAHARKAWAKIAMLGAVGLGLRMLYADDPEYEEINDRLRATHWVMKINGTWVFVPKPFELATISNSLERAYEGQVLKDPKAGERLLSDFRYTIAPPSEIPGLAVPFHLAKNRDYLGRPIVPDHLLGTVDPELQFNSYTSDLGKLIGRTFKLSPAQVDYVITGFGGSLGRYVQQTSNLIGETVTGRPRTAAGPEDTLLARRFVRLISRGSNSQAKFWDEISRDGGEMTEAEGSVRALMRDNKDEEAATYLNRLPPDERAYVIAKVFSGDGMSVVHPLVRTQSAIGAVGDFRSAVRDGTLRDGTGQVIQLTPSERRNIDRATADFAMIEMRNALIETGVMGWSQRERMDAGPALAAIRRADPAAYEQLLTQLALAKGVTAAHPQAQDQLNAVWGQLRPMLEGPGDPAQIVQAIRQRRATNGDRAARYAEAQRRAGGAYSPPSGAQRAARFARNALTAL